MQEVGRLRDLQVDRRSIVLELELHPTFEEKPVAQLPEKKSIKGGIEKWIFTTARGEPGSAITSKQKLRRSRKCLLQLGLQRVDFLAQFVRSGLRRNASHKLLLITYSCYFLRYFGWMRM